MAKSRGKTTYTRTHTGAGKVAERYTHPDQQGLSDFASSLGPLGEIRSVRQTSTSLRGGMRYRGFAVEFANGTHVNLSTYFTNDGKIEQFLAEPVS